MHARPGNRWQSRHPHMLSAMCCTHAMQKPVCTLQSCKGLTSAGGPSHWQTASPAAATWTAAPLHGWRAEPAGHAPAAAGPHPLQPSGLVPDALPRPTCTPLQQWLLWYALPHSRATVVSMALVPAAPSGHMTDALSQPTCTPL